VIADGKRICTFQPITDPMPAEPVLVGQIPIAPPFDYYHQNQIQSTSVLTNRDGTLAQELQYSAYGAELYVATANEYPLYNRFTDQFWDTETGLYYFGARYYDPAIGRFIQADTHSPDVYNPQGLNRYSYVLNNPFRYVDPTGHSWWDSVKNAVKGAVLGDFAGEDLGIAGMVGQVAIGLSPLGVLADIRDFAAAGVKVIQGEGSLGDLASAGANLVPGVSEGRKIAAVVGAASEVAGQVLKHSDEVVQVATTVARKSEDAVGAVAGKVLPSGGGQTAYRYVGEGEAKVAAAGGFVPNTDRAGNLKNVSLTTEQYSSAAKAEEGLAIGRNDPRGAGYPSPTHRIEVDTSHTKFDYVGNSATGGGIELQTRERVPVVRIDPLDP
jgi:RHS repeat-associated protein